MMQTRDKPVGRFWRQLREELVVYIVFYGLAALLGAIGMAYLALGVGLLLLLIPYAVIVALAIVWWRKSR